MAKSHNIRLAAPLVRRGGELAEASWEQALDEAARGLSDHRAENFGMFSCSKATNEVNYLAQKFARTVMDSNNIDSCNRT